jgi:hypothetical protein
MPGGTPRLLTFPITPCFPSFELTHPPQTDPYNKATPNQFETFQTYENHPLQDA